MWRRSVAAVLLLFTAVANDAAAQSSKDFIAAALSALKSGRLTIFAPAIQREISANRETFRQQVTRPGKLEAIEVLDDIELPTGHLVQGRTVHVSGVLYWTVGYSSQSQLIETLELNSAKKTAQTYRTSQRRHHRRVWGGAEGAEAETSFVCPRLQE